MKKLLILFGAITLIVACGSSKETVSKTVEKVIPMDVTEFAATITEAELKEMLYTYASDEFQGRETGDQLLVFYDIVSLREVYVWLTNFISKCPSLSKSNRGFKTEET